MAGKKISELPNAENLSGAIVPIVQEGTNKQAGIDLFSPELTPISEYTETGATLAFVAEASVDINKTFAHHDHR